MKHRETRGVKVLKIKGIYWVRDSLTNEIISWSLNYPDTQSLSVLSRAVGWQHNLKATSEELTYYKGVKDDEAEK